MKIAAAIAITSSLLLTAVTFPASAKVVQLQQVSWWALHGGEDEEGEQVCALVSSPPNLAEARFAFQYAKGRDGIFVRLVKPTWSIPRGTTVQVSLRFGYRPGRLAALKGRGTELRGFIPGPEARAFLSDHASGRLDVTFHSGNEPPWELSTGGFGFLLPEFGKCIEMLQPASPAPPPTQPF